MRGKADAGGVLFDTSRPAAQESSSQDESYCEAEVNVESDVLELATRIYEDSDARQKCIYEVGGELNIALGARFDIEVRHDGSCSVNGETWAEEPSTDPLVTVASICDTLPICGWRAYGTAAFELAEQLSGTMQAVTDQSPLRLFVPKTEVRLCRGKAKIRAFTADKLIDAIERVRRMDEGGHRASDVAVRSQRSNDSAERDPEQWSRVGASYVALVRAAKQGIADRQFQKVIASREVRVPFPVDLAGSYLAGRRQNTPARSYIMAQSGLAFAGFSPETVLEVKADGSVSTQPLAGTRALEGDATIDGQLEQELRSDTKEIAEHAMSVKLAFEELEEVCQQGSINVSEFMTVSRRGSVQHLASRLTGRLKHGHSCWHAFRQLFPAVTASGIPKRAALKWIREHEERPRGPYSGAVLMLDEDGRMDAALVLRTIFQRGEATWLRAGAGIVDASQPEREFEETCEKLRCVARYLVPSVSVAQGTDG